MHCPHCDTELPDGSRFCSICGADLKDPEATPRRTSQITDLFARLSRLVEGRYEIEGLVGRGGMGAVFKAKDLTLERPVAVKVLPPEMSHDDKFVSRFEREARTAAKLDHPNIIPIYAVESSGGLHYFVMKFVAGRGLDQIIESGPMPVDLVQRILWQAGAALGHAHSRGVIHRDIKPANIMIDDGGRAVLTDFGISKALQAATNLTATGQVIGTPHYMSPEQAKGLQVDGRSDQYSLALVGYRMLTGELPFNDESVHTVLYKQIFEDPPPIPDKRPDAPEFLVTALMRAMAKDPKDRFGTMEEFATAVWPENPVHAVGASALSSGAATTGPSLMDQPTEITPSTPAPKTPPRGAPPQKKKSKMVPAVAAAVVLVGGVGTAYVLMQGGGTTPEGAAVATTAADSQVTPPPDTAATPPAVTRADTQSTPLPEQPATTPPRETRPAPARQEPARQPARQPEPTPVTPPPVVRNVGFLTVSATPFGRLSLDGVEIQDTPLVGYELDPGRHVIEVAREGFETIVDTVDITTNNTTRKSYVLIRKE